MSLSPILTSTPGSIPTYNNGMAETFSWIPIEGADRPLYAKATYLTNASDISITTGDLSLDITPLENLTRTTNTKLDSLTAIQTAKQNEIITLLNSVTGMAIQVDMNTDDLKINVDQVETLLQQITSTNASANGQKGVDVIVPGSTYTGNWSFVSVLSGPAKFQIFDAKYSNTSNLLLFELPQQYSFSAPITSMRLLYGSVIAYK